MLRPEHEPEPQFIQQESTLEMFTIEQATPSQLGATSTMREDNLQFIQLNIAQQDDSKEASAVYGYGNSAFEGTLGLASGPSHRSNNRNTPGSSANEVLMCEPMHEPMQMSTEHLLANSLRSEDQPPSWAGNENVMQDANGSNYIEQTLKLNAIVDEKARTNEKSAKGDSVAVLDR